MNRLINLSGQNFSSLTVINRLPTKKRRVYWRCQCKCGNPCIVTGDKLVSGHTKSCGCRRVKKLIQRNTIHNQGGTKTRTRTYNSWTCMRQRCNNPNNPQFSYYGGRGITICARWKHYKNFFADMGAKPSKYHTLDRINNEKGYTKDNCRWATAKQQANNRRPRRKKS